MSYEKTILIVEDAEENVVFLSQIMEDHGYPYRVAVNGKEAIASMKSEPPALVLLDIMMPRKSGIGVYEEMKKDPALEKVPIIFITGASKVTGVSMRSGEEEPKKADADEFSRAFGTAMYEKMKGLSPDGFIEKPIDPLRLLELIKQNLS